MRKWNAPATRVHMAAETSRCGTLDVQARWRWLSRHDVRVITVALETAERGIVVVVLLLLGLTEARGDAEGRTAADALGRARRGGSNAANGGGAPLAPLTAWIT